MKRKRAAVESLFHSCHSCPSEYDHLVIEDDLSSKQRIVRSRSAGCGVCSGSGVALATPPLQNALERSWDANSGGGARSATNECGHQLGEFLRPVLAQEVPGTWKGDVGLAPRAGYALLKNGVPATCAGVAIHPGRPPKGPLVFGASYSDATTAARTTAAPSLHTLGRVRLTAPHPPASPTWTLREASGPHTRWTRAQAGQGSEGGPRVLPISASNLLEFFGFGIGSLFAQFGGDRM